MVRAYFLLGVEDLSVPFRIRDEVFVKEQGFSAETEKDDMDVRALHAVIEEDGVPCGTGRLFFGDGGWHIGRMAVLREKRGLRYGDLLVRMLVDRALSIGAQEIYVGAQKHAQGFYEKLGFRICGEEYEEEGCPHVPMLLTKERADALLFGGCGAKEGCAGCGGCEGCGGCGENQ